MDGEANGNYLQVTERSAAAAEFVVEAGLNESRTNNGLHHHHHQAPLTVSASSSTGYSNNGIDAVHLPPGTRAQIRRTLITDDDPVEAERMLHDLDPKSPAELLKFVQDKITPLVGSDDESTKQLEKAMMLITFGKNADNFPSEGDRCKLMEDLDVVILRQFDMSPTPLLTSIVKYMAMEQAKASESNGTVCVVPQLTDVGSATFSTVPSPPPMPTNGTTAGHGSATSREVIISDTSSDGGEAVPLATLLGRSSADDSSDADNQSSGD
ncbi:hypothetical protein Pmar_PMAR025358 [Perkinsus marinus ATCC 50983]|uniref:Uncharacterized protein n=1 Tax=Perkinsus marinus (strain ATCC 50983 / TXsc) TaxID=423536 RepID=C5KS34_PERM5|nr:hypothetical protein Pmar_PMAR025358 [Perkinsus marinus ATCC 50983]EER12725.1 hypothetical protein Pmar_PMAR025358 [Perkinsus marinus ATCC 50983]|eukprot:XP_002780930.1 hypothetical protein Pmar_PMAR025358 [Perkinsus marinus ATCC 50983]